MRRLLTPLILFPALIAGTLMHGQKVTTLDALRDHKRVLLIFAGGHDLLVEQQWNILVKHLAEATERDLTSVLLTHSLVKTPGAESAPSANFSQKEEQTLRTRFHIRASQFTVVLTGKDGGEKLRSHQPIPWQTLQSTIDAMPMRQSEMRHTR